MMKEIKIKGKILKKIKQSWLDFVEELKSDYEQAISELLDDEIEKILTYKNRKM